MQEQPKAKQNSRYKKAHKYFSEWHNIVTTLTLLFVAAYTVLTYCALQNVHEQVSISRDTEQRQLRAYIGIEKADLFIDEKMISGLVSLKNAGQTPAYDFSKWDQMATRPSDTSFVVPPMSDPDTYELSRTLVSPGVAIIATGKLAIASDNSILFPSLQDGRAVVYLWGEAQYRDTFGHPWCLEFRLKSYRQSDGGWALSPTPEGNKESDRCPNWPKK